MVCVHCGGRTNVINSRSQTRSNRIWRRRRCQNCSAIFTSLEQPLLETTWVVKRGSQLVPFSRDKLFLSIYNACKHRDEAILDAGALTDTTIGGLSREKLTVFEPQHIVRLAINVLGSFDNAAAVQYHAFHPSAE